MICNKRLSSLFAFSFLFLAIATDASAAPKIQRFDRAVLSVLIKDDAAEIKSETEYRIKKNGKEYRLHFPRGKEPKGLVSGTIVNVKGKKLTSSSVSVGSDSSSFQIVSAPELAGVGGVRQALVLKIQSATAVSPASGDSIAAALRQADTWYQESSYQMLSVKNDLENDGIADVYTVTVSDSTASAPESSTFTLCRKAQTNAPAQVGIDPSRWTHVICILPPDMAYSWFGTAYINGREIVINGNYAGGYPGGYTHEIGHNLGMHHANTPGTEYGESSCVMGGNAGTARRDFNGPHKVQMAWLPVATASAGTFELNAVEAQPGARVASHNVLKIRDAVAGQDLYVSYRAPLGSFGPGLAAPYKTSIHSYSGGAVQTQLLSSLGDGQSFSRNGITITQTAHSAASGTIVIGAECAAAAPAVTVSPAAVSLSSPAAASFTVTVQNKDVNCASSVNYALSVAAPASLVPALGSSTMAITAGSSGATSLVLNPAAVITTGTYQATITVSAAGHPNASAAVTYTLDMSAPSAPGGLTVTSPRKGKVQLSWSASSDQGSGISSYVIYRNGAAISSTSALSFSDSVGSGTYSYYVVAQDKAGNSSAPSNTAVISLSNRRK